MLTAYDTLFLYDRHARARNVYIREGCHKLSATQGQIPPMAEPALAKVTIFELAKRPWGWLSTSAEVDDRVYIGSEMAPAAMQCRVLITGLRGQSRQLT